MIRKPYSFAVLFLLSIVTVSSVGTAAPAHAFQSSSRFNEEREIYHLVNRERARKRLGMLVWDDQLAAIARNYSAQMAREGFFDHVDAAGESVQHRAFRANMRDWRKIGENLFSVSSLDDYPSLAVRMWMRSDSHRENILDRSWSSTGIGIAVSADGRTYVTQVFLADR